MRCNCRAASSDGMFRYLKYFHDARGCFDGLFSEWRSGQGQLPPLSGADGRRPGRFRQHGRGRSARYSRVLLEAPRRIRMWRSFRRKRCDGRIGICNACPGYEIGRTSRSRSQVICGSDEAFELADEIRCVLPDLIIVDGGKGHFRPRAANCSDWACTIFPLSAWPRNTKRFTGRAGPCRCNFRWTPALCDCCNAFVTKPIDSPTHITNCS